MKIDEYDEQGTPIDANFDDEALEALVEMVGSEEEVEAAAKEAFEELAIAFEKNEIEIEEDSIPEKLAMASLIVKLVEKGKLGPEDADSFIKDFLE